MKIIIATPLYPPEIERLAVYTRNLAQYLQTDHKVTVLVYASQVEEDNIDIVKINKNQPLFIRLFSYTWKLFKLAKKSDLIYVQNAVASGLPAIIVKYLTKIPVVINFSEDEAWKRAVNLKLSEQSLEEFLKKPKLNRDVRKIIKIQARVLRRASKVIVSSNFLAKLISKAYKISEENIAVNYIPEDREEKISFETAKVSQQIFAKGDLVDWTGMEDIIEAVAKLKQNFGDIKLIISGDGPNRSKLIEFSKDLAAYEDIKFLGKISKAEDWYLLKTSQAYIHNFSNFDPLNQITQSFLAETVVIARNTEINQEMLSNNQSGFLLKENTSDELAYKIEQVFNDDNLAQELTHKAKRNLEDKFSWPAHLSKLNNILLSIVKK